MGDFAAAIELILGAERILLTSHVRPDADAIGSVAGLERVIGQQGAGRGRSCTTEILFLSDMPNHCAFLLEKAPIVVGKDVTEEYLRAEQLDKFDLIIVADTSAERQLPGIGDYLKERKDGVLVLDHHLTSDRIGSCRVIDKQAAATGGMVYELCRAADWGIDEVTAGALFAALATDTGWFRFANASEWAYRIAGELIGLGARPDQLYRQLYQNFCPERLHLRALTLKTLELHCEGRLAFMQITKAMLAEAGAERSLIENIVNEPMEIGSVEAAVLAVEREDGRTRCSLRSRELIDVNAVARGLGGGGHERAAGVNLEVEIGTARETILQAMSRALEV